MKNIFTKSMEKEGTKNKTLQMKIRTNIRSGLCAPGCVDVGGGLCQCPRNRIFGG